jgi:N-acetylglucosaminyl-diphospho-decaprenol L-rhamnosyltransferase
MHGSNPLLRRMPRSADLDIGVVYTHEDRWMPRLLSSLAASGPRLRTRLLLVDNASEKGTQAWEDYFPDTVVLRNPQRLFYAANLNRIVAAATAPLVLLLNTDMYFEPQQHCLTKMVEFMRRHPECGVAGCRIYHEDGSEGYAARRFQNLRIILSRRLGLGRFLPGTLENYFYQERELDAAWSCDWLSGCFLLLRREALADVGPFDTGFVKYFEDVDLCLRMARAGWTPMYNGRTYCYHLEERASRRLLSAGAWRHARAYVRWLAKWGLSPGRDLPPPRERRRAA